MSIYEWGMAYSTTQTTPDCEVVLLTLMLRRQCIQWATMLPICMYVDQ